MVCITTDGKGLFENYYDEVLESYLGYTHVAVLNSKRYNGPLYATYVSTDDKRPFEGNERLYISLAFDKFINYGYDVKKPDYRRTLRDRKPDFPSLSKQQWNRINKHCKKYWAKHAPPANWVYDEFMQEYYPETDPVPTRVRMWGRSFTAKSSEDLRSRALAAISRAFIKDRDNFDFDKWSQTGPYSPTLIEQQKAKELNEKE